MAILLTLIIRCEFFRACKRWFFKVIHPCRLYWQYMCCVGLFHIPECISNITLCFRGQYAFFFCVRCLSEKSKKQVSTLPKQAFTSYFTYILYIYFYKHIYMLKTFFPSDCIVSLSQWNNLSDIGWKVEEKTNQTTVLYGYISQLKVESSK